MLNQELEQVNEEGRTIEDHIGKSVYTEKAFI